MATGRALSTDAGSLIAGVVGSTGLDLGGVHEDRMFDAVERARRDAGVPTMAAYIDLVTRNDRAYADLVDRLTVGETYFFRELGQIELIRSIARTWADDPRPRRVWSAGCASGEEAYSLAIVMEQEGVLDRCRIVGTDLSPHALDRARAARYTNWSLRRCDATMRATYFDQQRERYHLHDRFVDAVDFAHHNLSEGPLAPASFDLVVCRNVLMYLRRDARADAAVALRDALLPDGHLIVGSSDPPLRAEGLTLARTDNGLVHRRETQSGPPPPPPATTSRRRADADRTRLRPVRRAPAPERTKPRSEPSDPDPEPDLALTISSMLDAGDVRAAEGLLVKAIAERPVDAELRVLAATAHLHAGRHTDAAAAASAAIYLDPDLVVAHLLLGRAEQQLGNPRTARRSFRNAHELLVALPPDSEVPYTGGERAGALANVATRSADLSMSEERP